MSETQKVSTYLINTNLFTNSFGKYSPSNNHLFVNSTRIARRIKQKRSPWLFGPILAFLYQQWSTTQFIAIHRNFFYNGHNFNELFIEGPSDLFLYKRIILLLLMVLKRNAAPVSKQNRIYHYILKESFSQSLSKRMLLVDWLSEESQRNQRASGAEAATEACVFNFRAAQ